jgi:hypothetical protein
VLLAAFFSVYRSIQVTRNVVLKSLRMPKLNSSVYHLQRHTMAVIITIIIITIIVLLRSDNLVGLVSL